MKTAFPSPKETETSLALDDELAGETHSEILLLGLTVPAHYPGTAGTTQESASTSQAVAPNEDSFPCSAYPEVAWALKRARKRFSEGQTPLQTPRP